MKRKMQINQKKYETTGKSKENYLKAILITNEKYGACRAADISRQLSVSKASASIALKKLGVSTDTATNTVSHKMVKTAMDVAKKNYTQYKYNCFSVFRDE